MIIFSLELLFPPRKTCKHVNVPHLKDFFQQQTKGDSRERDEETTVSMLLGKVRNVFAVSEGHFLEFYQRCQTLLHFWATLISVLLQLRIKEY